MAKPPYPVKRTVHLSELQAQQAADFRDSQGLPSDDEAIRQLLEAVFDLMQRYPEG